uniref:Chromodomain-helicase-DNA-binding protein 1 n=1 Tax=Angiostrongylus cantonensis TaxID=6313 RepID=A0A158P933_ANGCA
MGAQGATGSATTCYNVAEKGDPNDPSAVVLEQHFLIKWVGWSHLHNTWESEASLIAMNANGIKKIQNFLKKQKEMEEWKQTVDKEYIEFYECEQVMNEELYEEYKKVERIVAHQVSRDRHADGTEPTEYYVKWCGLSYSDCTWEDSRLLPAEMVQAYHRRIENYRAPSRNASVLRKRPKFVKIEDMPSFLQFDGKNQTLRDYQLEGLNWMLHAWCKHNSCILADEMGLGKTIQAIAFLATLYHKYELFGPFLVVVPLSTMAAWQKEFLQWAPDMNLITYMGDVNSREQIRQFEWYIAGTRKIKVNTALTTYEILLKDKPFLGSFQWATLIVDEAHRLKNDESLLYSCLSSFNCDHRLLITGTPLQNSLKELWALLHFIMPEKFSSWLEFESGHNDKDHKGISALHRKLEPFLLRRVKKDVEKSLPPKLEQILRVDMTAQQKQYYKWILTKNYHELSKGVKGSINGFVNLAMELKKCCNHTSLVRQYDHLETDPQARLQQLLKSSGKLILLDKLLCRLKDTGHRVLIFSQMVMMLDILQEYLQLRRFPAQRLDGSMRADLRKQALDHYNAEGSTDFAFLLSTRAGGLGINLATADTVIIFDSDWNPQNDLQAMSRAHRIGQTRQVNIYRLVTRNSMEEEIVERAKRKLVLDHLVIQRMDTTGRTVLSKSSVAGARAVPFDKKELNDILKFGAADLFKEGDGEEQEPEVDIDRILSGAETRDEGGNELLNSFKYANFSINEEQDVAAANETGWDEIIPEVERQKIEEEERRKLAADLELAPRQRVRLEIEEAIAEDDSASDGDAESTGRKKRKKAFGEFSVAEVKRFVRSFKKFARPLQRLEALAQDAELEEHSAEELRKLAEALLEGCEKAEKEHSLRKHEVVIKDRGPSFKFSGVVDVNVRSIRKLHSELEPLHRALSDGGIIDFKPHVKARPQKGWDVEWTLEDDSALLRGVFKYGIGSWEAIKMDPVLGLADKIFIKDKVRKPQPRHLQQRVDYLLKLMDKAVNEVRTVRSAQIRKRRALDSDKLASNIVEKYLHKINLECVKMMRPVQKYIKKLAEATSEKEATKYLLRLGDNCLIKFRKPKTNVRKWYNYMWIFLSKFVPQEPMEMLEKYRELCNNRHKHREHNHIQKDYTPPKHDGERKRDDDKRKKDVRDCYKKRHHYKAYKSEKDHRLRKYHAAYKVW